MGCANSNNISDPLQKLTDIEVLLKTIEKNINTDYEQSYTDTNLINVIQLFRKVFNQRGQQNQTKIYRELKQKVKNNNQRDILEWIETKRAKKYSAVTFPQCKVTSTYQTAQLCPTTDDLRMSRITHKYSEYMKETALMSKVKIGKSQFFLREVELKGQQNIRKMYHFRQKINSGPQPTPWIAEQTKDCRYVWRGDIDLDKENVAYLMKFILTKRQGRDECPSILINAGSHGGNFGKNAHSTGNFQLTQIRIYDEMIDIISSLMKDTELKLNKENIRDKIYVHKLSSSIPCTYSLFADHIIDVQCSGAYEKVLAQYLVPRGTQHDEVDLLFLDSEKQPIKEKKNNQSPPKKDKPKNAQKKSQTIFPQVIKPSKQQPAPQNNIKNIKPKAIIQEPKPVVVAQQPQTNKQAKPQNQNIKSVSMQTNSDNIKKMAQIAKNLQVPDNLLSSEQQLLSKSSIVKTRQDASKLLNFFSIKAKGMRLLFKASEHKFLLSKYWPICGQQNNTMIICKTQKNKIIGAFSPLSHEFSLNSEAGYGEYAMDLTKRSFIFSLTQNDKFFLDNINKAVYRIKNKTAISFGDAEFKICDQANQGESCCAQINLAYYNQKYRTLSEGLSATEYCMKFNGNNTKYFNVKQWEVWKVYQ